MRRLTRLTRPLAGAALALLVTVLAACSDAALPTAAPRGGPRTNAAPLGTPWLAVSGLGQDLCADIQGAGDTPGDLPKQATIYICHGRANQQLTFQPTGEVTLYGGTVCLDVWGAQGNDGDDVKIWTCNGGANQQWRYVSDGRSAYGPIMGMNGKCLDVWQADPTPGARLVLHTCNGGANQQWALRSPGPVPADIGGSAELPRTYLDTRMPAVTGRTIDVAAGGDLQAALDAAVPGDQVVLAPGATFVGNFRLRPKAGTSAAQWVTVRSGGALPVEGTRVGPGDAGEMPKLLTPNQDAALYAEPGASGQAGAQGWRLVGLEIGVTAQPNLPDNVVYSLVDFGAAGAAQNTSVQVPGRLVLDRSYVHGAANLWVRRCLALNSAASAVVDSYLAECHQNYSDSQAIIGWNGPGPFKIVNNYLEGGHEVVFFGGSDPSIRDLVPSDIEIRHNHITRPASWKGVWQVKNLFELKAGRRVLVEGNVFENSWNDAQSGFAFVWSSTNQDGGCTWCETSDVTFRYNRVKNVSAGFNLFTLGSADSSGVSVVHRAVPMARVTVAHNVITGVGILGPRGEGNGRLIGVGGSIDGLTIVRNSGLGTVSNVFFGSPNDPLTTMVYRDNVTGGEYILIADQCCQGADALRRLQIPAGNVTGNVIYAGQGGFVVPPGNTYVSSPEAIGFVDYAGGDLRLSDSSPYLRSGSGGSRPGADVEAVNRMTQGVVR